MFKFLWTVSTAILRTEIIMMDLKEFRVYIQSNSRTHQSMMMGPRVQLRDWSRFHSRQGLPLSFFMSFSQLQVHSYLLGSDKRASGSWLVTEITAIAIHRKPQWSHVGCFNDGRNCTARAFLKSQHPHLSVILLWSSCPDLFHLF